MGVNMKKILLSLLLIISFCILLSVSGCEVTGGSITVGHGRIYHGHHHYPYYPHPVIVRRPIIVHKRPHPHWHR